MGLHLRNRNIAAADDSPFYPENAPAYRHWRERKLADYPRRAHDLVVELRDPRAPSAAEIEELHRRLRQTNMAIYASAAGATADKDIPRRLGARFGLRRLDGNMLADEDSITSLHVVPGKSERGYIPYSNRRLLWHTDGYYNPPQNRIRAFVLHCVAPAAEGGENALLDHEIVYLLLRDANPEYIRALMQPDAMTIPPNTEAGAPTRPVSIGPVFSVDAAGNLHMRYTARTRSILWRQDDATRAAVRALEALLADGSPYIFRHRLAAGQGLLCNNVLHNRTSFSDDAGHGGCRLLYRARYYDRVSGTNLDDIFGQQGFL